MGKVQTILSKFKVSFKTVQLAYAEPDQVLRQKSKKLFMKNQVQQLKDSRWSRVVSGWNDSSLET